MTRVVRYSTIKVGFLFPFVSIHLSLFGVNSFIDWLFDGLAYWLSITRFAASPSSRLFVWRKLNKTKQSLLSTLTLTIRGELLLYPWLFVVALMWFVRRLSSSLSPLTFSFFCSSVRQRAAIRLSLSELIFTSPEFIHLWMNKTSNDGLMLFVFVLCALH